MSLDAIEQQVLRASQRHEEKQPEVNEVSLDEVGDSTVTPFQRLSLAIPIDPSNYSFIAMLLSRILNLEDANQILPKEKELQAKYSPTEEEFSFNSKSSKKSIDILPSIAIPTDIWLVDNIQVKDIKIKTNILQEINAITSESMNIDETTLLYHEKLLSAYKVYDIPNRQSIVSYYTNSVYSTSSYIGESLKEEEEDTDLVRTLSNNSSHSQKTQKSQKSQKSQTSSQGGGLKTQIATAQPQIIHSNGAIHSNGSANGQLNGSSQNGQHLKRSSGLSQRKRFLALLGLVTHSHHDEQTTSPSTPTTPIDDKQQNLNNLITKSRIYNKIKRHRESGSSLNLTMSTYSNRNSISTTNTTTSNSSRRRSNSSYFLGNQENDLKISQIQSNTASSTASIVAPSVASLSPLPLLSPAQKSENRKLKYDYYIQLGELKATTQKIVEFSIANSSDSAGTAKLMKFIEFIKKKVLRFVIIDIFQMIVDYGQFRAYDLYSKQ